jgi:hypothetical protein
MGRSARRIQLEEPEPGTYSVRDIVGLLLREPARARRHAWFDALVDHAEPSALLERELGHARLEVSSRLGIPDPLAMAPYDQGALGASAQAILTRTDDLARALFQPCEDLSDLASLLLSREVRGVWPAQPSARWLRETFERTPLLEGLSPDLGPLPPPRGASSFARALARFGAAYARDAALGHGPFVTSLDPADAHPRRRGALFGSLLAEPIFLRKVMGFSRDEASAVARTLARTLLGAIRLEATRTLVDIAVAPPADVEDALHRAFACPVPRAAGSVLPRPCPEAWSRFAAMLLAALDSQALIEQFDDDWFKNPRALLALREEDAAPRAIVYGPEAFSGAVAAIGSRLEALAS